MEWNGVLFRGGTPVADALIKEKTVTRDGGMDIILTCNYSPWSRYCGGGQKSAHMVASAHAQAGHRVTLLCTKAPWEKVRVPEGLPYQVAWTPFIGLRPGISSPLRFLNALTVLRKARSLSKPGTILHGNGDEAALLWKVEGAKFVFTSRYPSYDEYLSRMPWLHPALAYLRCLFREPRFLGMGLAARFASVVTATSGYAAKDAEKAFGLPSGSIEVVPNGIDDAFLEGALPDGTGKGVLFFGRLTRAKGCDLLLEAWSGLPEAVRREHPLTFVGQGPLRRELEERSRELEGVHFVGWSRNTELRSRIRAARVVGLPSLEESFGNAMIETLALGQDLVTTDAGSIPEVCGPWGTRVPAGDAVALRKALARVLAGGAPCDRAGQREWVRASYSWASTTARFRELYGREDASEEAVPLAAVARSPLGA